MSLTCHLILQHQANICLGKRLNNAATSVASVSVSASISAAGFVRIAISQVPIEDSSKLVVAVIDEGTGLDVAAIEYCAALAVDDG